MWNLFGSTWKSRSDSGEHCKGAPLFVSRQCFPNTGPNNAGHPEGGTEYGIEDSDEKDFQDCEGIAPSSKAVLLVSQKEKMKLKAIQRTEDVLIGVDEGNKDQDPLKENELIL